MRIAVFDVKREVGESVSKTAKGVEHLHLASHSVCLQYQAMYSHVMMSNRGTVVKRNQPIESRRLSSGFPIRALRMQRKQPYQEIINADVDTSEMAISISLYITIYL